MSLPANPPAFPQFLTDAANTVGDIANNISQGVRNNPITNFLWGNAMNTAQDIGTGLALNGQTGQNMYNSQDNATKLAQQAEQKAQQTQDPQEKARLLKVASDSYDTVNQNMQGIANNFSPDIVQNPLQRGLETGIEAGTGADIAAHPIQTVKGMANIALHPIQAVKSFRDLADTVVNNPKEIINNAITNPDNFKLTQNEGLTKLGNRWLLGQYKNADAVSHDPLGTVSMLKNYDLTNPQEISDAALKVTGSETAGEGQALVHKKVLNAVSQADPVDVNGITNQAINNMDDLTNVTEPQAERALNTVKRKIMNTTGLNIQNNEMLNAELSKGANAGLTDANPTKVFQTTRQIDQLANTAYSAAYDKQGNLINPAQKELADFYSNTSATLKDRLFNGTTSDPNVMRLGANNVRLSGSWTPEEISVLKSIGNGKLADDITNTNTVPELRKYEALFTQGGKMADQVLSQGEKSPSLTQMATALASTFHPSPLDIGVFGASTRAGKELIGNSLNTAGQLVGEPSATLKSSLALQGTKQLIPGVGDNQNGNNNQNNNPHITPNITPNGQNVNIPTQGVDKDGFFNVTNIPNSPNGVNLDQQGNLVLPSPSQIKDVNGKIVGIDTNTYNQQTDLLQKDMAAHQKNAYSLDPTIANPAKAAIQQDQNQLDSLNVLKDSSTGLNNGYNLANTVSGKVSSALSDLNTTSPSVANLNSSINNLEKALDPNYAGLSQQLKTIQKQFGTSLNGTTAQSLRAELYVINQQIGYDYLTAVKTYVGGNITPQNGMQLTPQGVPQFPTSAPQSLPSTPPDFSNITGGSLPAQL